MAPVVSVSKLAPSCFSSSSQRKARSGESRSSHSIPVRPGQTIDMTGSGYDVDNDYMYFKPTVYNQNDSGKPDDYMQATFYELDARPSEYER